MKKYIFILLLFLSYGIFGQGVKIGQFPSLTTGFDDSAFVPVSKLGVTYKGTLNGFILYVDSLRGRILTPTQAAVFYQKKGSYATINQLQLDSIALLDSIRGKQPIGDYATKSKLLIDSIALADSINGKQPIGSYATNAKLLLDSIALADSINGKQPIGNYATITKVQGDSGTLAAAINGKQPIGNYATTTKVQGDSGTLAAAINGKQDAGSYATTTKVQGDSGILAAAINGKQPAGSYATTTKVQGDSGTLAAAIAAKGNGTVTSITLGSGMTGSSGTITTSGAIAVDSGSVLILSRDRAAATYATKSKVQADSIALAAHADNDTVNLRPRLVAGANITIAGTYPNLTIGSSGGSSSLTNFTDGAILFSSSQTIAEDSLNFHYSSNVGRLSIGSYTGYNDLIPSMSGNSSPIPYKISASSGDNGVYQMMGRLNFGWGFYNPLTWIQIDMGSNTTVNSYHISNIGGTGSYSVQGWIIKGSNDTISSHFVNLDVRTGYTDNSAGMGPVFFSFNQVSIASYRYYRIYYTNIVGGSIPFYVSTTGFGLYNSTTTYLTPQSKLHITTVNSTEKGQIIQGVASQSADLEEWQNSAGTILAKVDASGNIKTGGTATVVGAFLDSSTVTSTAAMTAKNFNSTIAPTAITGAGGSGTAYFSEPFQGTATNGGYKEIVIYLNAFVSSGGTTITYSSSGGIAFTNAPYVYGTSSCISQVGTPTATSITITSSTALNGYVFLKGN